MPTSRCGTAARSVPVRPDERHRHEQEDALGLVDIGGRFYDPYQRRFMTPDPFVVDATSTQSWNAYTYVRNNPLNRIDPTGFWDAEDYSDCHCPDYPDGHPDQPDTYVAGDPGGYGHDDLGYDPGDIGALGNEDRLAEFDNLGGEMGPDFASGGNDGSTGVGKQQDAGLPAGVPEMPIPGVLIDGPDAPYFTRLLNSARDASPSFARRLAEHATSGRVIVLITVKMSSIVFGYATVVLDGAPGVHELDTSDYELFPTDVLRQGALVHEVVEAIAEFDLPTLPPPGQARVNAWWPAHLAGIQGQNEFRSDTHQEPRRMDTEPRDIARWQPPTTFLGIPYSMLTRTSP